jgi:hypothetical protein
MSINTAGDGKKFSRTQRRRRARRTLSEVKSRARSNAARRATRGGATPLRRRRRARGEPVPSRKPREIEKEIRKRTADTRSAGKVARGAPRASPPALALALVAGAPQQLPLLVLAHLLAALFNDVSQDPTSSSPGRILPARGRIVARATEVNQRTGFTRIGRPDSLKHGWRFRLRNRTPGPGGESVEGACGAHRASDSTRGDARESAAEPIAELPESPDPP